MLYRINNLRLLNDRLDLLIGSSASVWTIGNGDPMQDVCIPHKITRPWE